jgi:hypothetical protein
VAAVPRPTLSLDGLWDFHFCGDARIELEEVPEWLPCTVPAPWQAQFADLRLRNGRAWYRRRFQVPEDAWAGGAVALCFGAVNHHAQVYVNGTLVGEHEGGWLPFETDIAAVLRPRLNEVAVHVTAPTDDPAIYPDYPFSETLVGKQSWYGPLGGIWQSVRLERRALDHIRSLRLRPCREDGSVALTVALARPLAAPHELGVRITGPEGRTIEGAVPLAVGQERVATTLVVPEALDWSPETPHLYEVEARLLHRHDAVDRVQERFGFRTIETRGGRLHLNGRPLFLRGALDQDYYAHGICTPPSAAFLEDQFRKAKALGLNCLRCHIKVPDPRYFEAADRMGLLIWAELPNAGRLSAAARERAEATLRGMVERDGNHPSIFCWTILNENWGSDLVHNAEDRAWLRRMVEWLKEEDPGRLVVDNSPLAPSFHVRSDLDDFHFYAAIPDHRRAWDGFVEALAGRPAWTWGPGAEVVRRGDEPLLCSEFGNWGLPDPEALRDDDGAYPWWFATGHDWGDGAALPDGFEHRFRAAGLERVFGSLGGFIEAAQWQQYRALKYQIESMRRRAAIAGYVITEFTDCHWEANGLLDIRRNPRAFHEAFAAINAETVVVPSWERTAYVSGEAVQIGVTAANGGAHPVDGVGLHWRCGGASGGDGPFRLGHGVRELRGAAFPAPGLESPAVQRLELQLRAGGRVVAANHVDLAVLPPRARPPQDLAVWAGDELGERLLALGYRPAGSLIDAEVVVARALDEPVCRAIRGGARVVVLADQPMELQPVFPHWQAARVVRRSGTMWQGDWISAFSWLRRDGPFARIPGGPLIDHAFDRVIPRHVVAGCSTWDFQARVHAGMVLGWAHKPAALIVERDQGRGRMVVTTFRLLDDAPGADPVATALLDGLLELAMGCRRG